VLILELAPRRNIELRASLGKLRLRGVMTDGVAAADGVNADTPASYMYSCRKKRNDNNAATVAIWVEPGNIIMAATVGACLLSAPGNAWW
jgi:hypothetical protein